VLELLVATYKKLDVPDYISVCQVRDPSQSLLLLGVADIAPLVNIKQEIKTEWSSVDCHLLIMYYYMHFSIIIIISSYFIYTIYFFLFIAVPDISRSA